jgi:NAD(P)-dependent dehydrogenase (short-subunit alcohol dehydrogenase family)
VRFDDQVVILTGAGRGLGRAHAIYLAAHGAKVVVNDLGTNMDGSGADSVLAQSVADEITAAGGEAVANGASVTETAGAESIVADALGHFGRVDAVINNAGIITYDPFPEMTLERLMQHLSIHVAGTFNVTRAAWPHMVNQGYGRVVTTTSAGLFGAAPLLAYSTCKGALVSMTRSLAEAGAEHGIKVNGLAPAAETRMVTDATLRARVGLPPAEGDPEPDPLRAPEAVSPMVAVLIHESCPVTGEILSSGLGRLARIFLAETEGFVEPGLGPEEILERWDDIVAPGKYTVPAGTSEYVARREAQIAERASRG